VKSAVAGFVTELEAVSHGQIDVAKLTADADAIGTACSAAVARSSPVGAAATGSGSTAGLQDAGLVYGGAAAIVAGAGMAGFGWRRRRRARLGL
jgi:hypothetical protein